MQTLTLTQAFKVTKSLEYKLAEIEDAIRVDLIFSGDAPSIEDMEKEAYARSCHIVELVQRYETIVSTIQTIRDQLNFANARHGVSTRLAEIKKNRASIDLLESILIGCIGYANRDEVSLAWSERLDMAVLDNEDFHQINEAIDDLKKLNYEIRKSINETNDEVYIDIDLSQVDGLIDSFL